MLGYRRFPPSTPPGLPPEASSAPSGEPAPASLSSKAHGGIAARVALPTPGEPCNPPSGSACCDGEWLTGRCATHVTHRCGRGGRGRAVDGWEAQGRLPVVLGVVEISAVGCCSVGLDPIEPI